MIAYSFAEGLNLTLGKRLALEKDVDLFIEAFDFLHVETLFFYHNDFLN